MGVSTVPHFIHPSQDRRTEHHLSLDADTFGITVGFICAPLKMRPLSLQAFVGTCTHVDNAAATRAINS
jgi:hypothetical protein